MYHELRNMWISWFPGFQRQGAIFPPRGGAGHLASPLLFKEVLKPSAATTADVVRHFPKRSEL